jgi:hypothetical protein
MFFRLSWTNKRCTGGGPRQARRIFGDRNLPQICGNDGL